MASPFKQPLASPPRKLTKTKAKKSTSITYLPMECADVLEINYLMFEGSNWNKSGITPGVDSGVRNQSRKKSFDADVVISKTENTSARKREKKNLRIPSGKKMKISEKTAASALVALASQWSNVGNGIPYSHEVHQLETILPSQEQHQLPSSTETVNLQITEKGDNNLNTAGEISQANSKSPVYSVNPPNTSDGTKNLKTSTSRKGKDNSKPQKVTVSEAQKSHKEIQKTTITDVKTLKQSPSKRVKSRSPQRSPVKSSSFSSDTKKVSESQVAENLNQKSTEIPIAESVETNKRKRNNNKQTANPDENIVPVKKSRGRPKSNKKENKTISDKKENETKLDKKEIDTKSNKKVNGPKSNEKEKILKVTSPTISSPKPKSLAITSPESIHEINMSTPKTLNSTPSKEQDSNVIEISCDGKKSSFSQNNSPKPNNSLGSPKSSQDEGVKLQISSSIDHSNWTSRVGQLTDKEFLGKVTSKERVMFIPPEHLAYVTSEGKAIISSHVRKGMNDMVNRGCKNIFIQFSGVDKYYKLHCKTKPFKLSPYNLTSELIKKTSLKSSKSGCDIDQEKSTSEPTSAAEAGSPRQDVPSLSASTGVTQKTKSKKGDNVKPENASPKTSPAFSPNTDKKKLNENLKASTASSKSARSISSASSKSTRSSSPAASKSTRSRSSSPALKKSAETKTSTVAADKSKKIKTIAGSTNNSPNPSQTRLIDNKSPTQSPPHLSPTQSPVVKTTRSTKKITKTQTPPVITEINKKISNGSSLIQTDKNASISPTVKSVDIIKASPSSSELSLINLPVAVPDTSKQTLKTKTCRKPSDIEMPATAVEDCSKSSEQLSQDISAPSDVDVSSVSSSLCVRDWSTSDVHHWLRENSLPHVIQFFSNVDGPSIMELITSFQQQSSLIMQYFKELGVSFSDNLKLCALLRSMPAK